APAMRNSVSPIDVTLPRLAGRTTHTEHRTPDSQVCRASRNGRFEVPAHSGRDDRGIGMVGTQVGRQTYKVLKMGHGVLAKGRNRHESAEGEVPGPGDRRGQFGYASRHDTRPPW